MSDSRFDARQRTTVLPQARKETLLSRFMKRRNSATQSSLANRQGFSARAVVICREFQDPFTRLTIGKQVSAIQLVIAGCIHFCLQVYRTKEISDAGDKARWEETFQLCVSRKAEVELYLALLQSTERQ